MSIRLVIFVIARLVRVSSAHENNCESPHDNIGGYSEQLVGADGVFSDEQTAGLCCPTRDDSESTCSSGLRFCGALGSIHFLPRTGRGPTPQKSAIPQLSYRATMINLAGALWDKGWIGWEAWPSEDASASLT